MTSSRLTVLIVLVVGVAVFAGAFGLATSPLWEPIGGLAGLTFWLLVVVLASTSSVRMPGGTIVDVGFAPVVVCASTLR